MVGLVDPRRLLARCRWWRQHGVRLLARLHEVVLLAGETLDLGVAPEPRRALLELAALLLEHVELLLRPGDGCALGEVRARGDDAGEEHADEHRRHETGPRSPPPPR